MSETQPLSQGPPKVSHPNQFQKVGGMGRVTAENLMASMPQEPAGSERPPQLSKDRSSVPYVKSAWYNYKSRALPPQSKMSNGQKTVSIASVTSSVASGRLTQLGEKDSNARSSLSSFLSSDSAVDKFQSVRASIKSRMVFHSPGRTATSPQASATLTAT